MGKKKGSGKNILLVDDEVNLVQMVTDILESEGFRVIPAYDAGECIEMLEGDEKVDLILLDIMMPHEDGWMLHRRIKENPEWKDIPIIILTAKTDTIDKKIGLEIAKVDDFITKPFIPEDLVKRITDILEG